MPTPEVIEILVPAPIAIIEILQPGSVVAVEVIEMANEIEAVEVLIPGLQGPPGSSVLDLIDGGNF